MFSLIRRLFGGRLSCFNCGTRVMCRVEGDGDWGSVGWVSTGILSGAGFSCVKCEVNFCGVCGGTQAVGTENYRYRESYLSIPCPQCATMVSSPIVKKTAG